MFGIRVSIAVLAAGVTDSTGLAAELPERSAGLWRCAMW